MTNSHQLISRMSGVSSRLHKFWKNEGGATAVIIGIMSPVIIGGMALGGETGYWYYTQRKLQHAADVAAYAAGVRKRTGEYGAPLQKAALQVASVSGFIPVMVNASPNPGGTELKAVNMTLNNPPVTGTSVGDYRAVEVILSEKKPRLLSSIFSKEPVEIRARAVSKVVGGSPACVLSLSGTAPRAVEVSGSTEVTLDGCSIAANSVQPDAYYMPNSTATLKADCISTVGGGSVKSSSPGLLTLECGSVQEQAPPTLDPYADVPEPIFPMSGCETASTFSGPISPSKNHPIYGPYQCYSNGLKIKANATATFAPGLYIITGGTLSVENNAILKSAGATFFFANNTTAQIAGGAKLDLTAPSSGIFAGIVFFGQRCDGTPGSCDEVFKITGNSGSAIKGAIYLPGSKVEYLGNTNSATSCLQIIADRVTFTGNSDIEMGSMCDDIGTKQVTVGQVVKLIE